MEPDLEHTQTFSYASEDSNAEKKIILTLIEKEEIGLQDKDLSFNSDGCLQTSQISENRSNFTKVVLLAQLYIPDLDKIFVLKNILCNFHKYRNF